MEKYRKPATGPQPSETNFELKDLVAMKMKSWVANFDKFTNETLKWQVEPVHANIQDIASW